MTETTSTAMQKITIQGLLVDVAAPYVEGHSLNEAEASTLNQVRAENVRNNCAKLVKEAREAAAREKDPVPFDEAAIRAKIAEYDNEYEFGVRNARIIVDPVTREALKLAKDAVRAKLKQKNIDVKSLGEGELDKLAEELLAAKPKFREIAQQRVEQLAALAEDEANAA